MNTQNSNGPRSVAIVTGILGNRGSESNGPSVTCTAHKRTYGPNPPSPPEQNKALPRLRRQQLAFVKPSIYTLNFTRPPLDNRFNQ